MTVTLNHSSLKAAQSDSLASRSVDDVQGWIVAYLSNLLETDPDNIDTSITFDRYGLDSAAAVGMTGDLEDWLGIEVDPTALYDYPTIESLVAYLAKAAT